MSSEAQADRRADLELLLRWLGVRLTDDVVEIGRARMMPNAEPVAFFAPDGAPSIAVRGITTRWDPWEDPLAAEALMTEAFSRNWAVGVYTDYTTGLWSAEVHLGPGRSFEGGGGMPRIAVTDAILAAVKSAPD